MNNTRQSSTLDRGFLALRAAVDLAGPDALDLPTPCDRWTVAQVIEHAVLDQGIWAAAIGDHAPPEGDAFAPTGVLPMDVPAMVDAALDRASRAWESLTPNVLRVPSPLPQGELDIDTARNAAALDAAVHAWDIATARGLGAVLDDALSAELLPTAQLIVEPLRQWGAYAAALPGAETDSATDTLLRYLGRDPQWGWQR